MKTALPIYCATCSEEIVMPCRYVIVTREGCHDRAHHIGCNTHPGLAKVVEGKESADSSQLSFIHD